MPLVLELEQAYRAAKADRAFQDELDWFLKHYVGRPSPLYFAERLTQHFGGAKIYFKRDELNHTGAHKINNCKGQLMLARRMGKRRIICETGAGQHGVATATVSARMRTRSRPASTIPASAPSTPGSRIRGASNTRRSPTARRSTRSSSA